MNICRTDCRDQVFKEGRLRTNVMARKKMRRCRTLDTGHWILDTGGVS